ncbi:MAG: GDSL-type esterase/lipase family protein [Chloroflexi bacterium]|nr:GDSL-type esterase/lipase family protein [Chloroflexota bacterium]
MTGGQMISATDQRLTWSGVVTLEITEDGVLAWRLPHTHISLYPPVALRERAAMPAGVRVAFRSTTRRLGGRFDPAPELAPLDVVCDGTVISTLSLTDQSTFTCSELPPGDKRIELWLPQHGHFRLQSLQIDSDATIAPVAESSPRWITYGSSITQCRQAASPTKTWPAVVARALGLDLTCLGFGGQCHLDPMIARLIRDLPADYLSMCVGINIYGAASLSPRTFKSAIIGFVAIVRERHPVTPFIVMSPICSPTREDTPDAVGFTLKGMREEVAGAVEILRSAGDQHLHYVDGLTIFGSELAHFLPDGLHPNAEGYIRLGERFIDKAASRYFVSKR